MKTRFHTTMKLTAQYCCLIGSTAATAIMLLAVLTWEFVRAAFNVVILGKNEETLL